MSHGAANADDPSPDTPRVKQKLPQAGTQNVPGRSEFSAVLSTYYNLPPKGSFLK